MSQMRQLTRPVEFSQKTVSVSLDNFDNADPFRMVDPIDNENTAPLVNAPFYDTSKETPIKKSNIGLDDLPDYSDEMISDYEIRRMLGQNVESMENIVDLDKADNYVAFIKNTIKNVIASESEFNIDRQEVMDNLLSKVNQ